MTPADLAGRIADPPDDWPDDDDGDGDEFAPNVCPDCGGDLDHDRETGVSWCPDPQCMWTSEDDDEEDADDDL